MVVLSADRFAAASAELRTFADVVRLADDPAWDIPYEVLFTIVARKVDVAILGIRLGFTVVVNHPRVFISVPSVIFSVPLRSFSAR